MRVCLLDVLGFLLNRDRAAADRRLAHRSDSMVTTHTSTDAVEMRRRPDRFPHPGRDRLRRFFFMAAPDSCVRARPSLRSADMEPDQQWLHREAGIPVNSDFRLETSAASCRPGKPPLEVTRAMSHGAYLWIPPDLTCLPFWAYLPPAWRVTSHIVNIVYLNRPTGSADTATLASF